MRPSTRNSGATWNAPARLALVSLAWLAWAGVAGAQTQTLLDFESLSPGSSVTSVAEGPWVVSAIPSGGVEVDPGATSCMSVPCLTNGTNTLVLDGVVQKLRIERSDGRSFQLLSFIGGYPLGGSTAVLSAFDSSGALTASQFIPGGPPALKKKWPAGPGFADAYAIEITSSSPFQVDDVRLLALEPAEAIFSIDAFSGNETCVDYRICDQGGGGGGCILFTDCAFVPEPDAVDYDYLVTPDGPSGSRGALSGQFGSATFSIQGGAESVNGLDAYAASNILIDLTGPTLMGISGELEIAEGALGAASAGVTLVDGPSWGSTDPGITPVSGTVSLPAGRYRISASALAERDQDVARFDVTVTLSQKGAIVVPGLPGSLVAPSIVIALLLGTGWAASRRAGALG